MNKLPIMPKCEIPIKPVNAKDLPQEYLGPGELEIIVALVRMAKQHRVMVEIGLAAGRTAKTVLREIPYLERYIGIDTDPNYKPKLTSQLTERHPIPGYLAMDDPRFDRWLLPKGSLDLVPDDFPPIDIVFIDGDHSSDVVRHDSNLARTIVEPGGIIIWHDYHNGGVEVSRVLEFDRSHGYELYNVENTWLAYERR
jgi:predicted O-methyltransferase YrrM